MAEYTDEELLFLSNLMHMRNEKLVLENGKTIQGPFADIWTSRKGQKKLADFLDKIDVNQLREEPYASYKFDGLISGNEWADMLEAMAHTDIGELVIHDVSVDDKKAISTCLKDADGNAYVVFRGTSAGEWEDNVYGGMTTDTEQQMRALEYINSLDIDHITVVGHSKGGNKAKYVALLSDKVDRCVSFDGQGFSELFIEKYQDLIEKNKEKITCYALDDDFVNILMYDIYNEKHYIEGNNVDGFTENHSPNALVHYRDGKIAPFSQVEVEQSDEMRRMHEFVNYTLATVPDDKREEFFDFLATTLGMVMGKKPPTYTDKYSIDEFIDFLASDDNQEHLGLLVAYILEYEKENEGITDTIFVVLESMMDDGIVKWIRKIEDFIGAENVLEFLIKYGDKVAWILDKIGAPDNIVQLINSVREGYNDVIDSVPSVSKSSISEYNMYADDYIRDFSASMRQRLLDITDRVNNEHPLDVAKWDIWYRMEDWFNKLTIDRYTNNIDEYFRKVIDINDINHQKLKEIFEQVDKVSQEYKVDLEDEIAGIRKLTSDLEAI